MMMKDDKKKGVTVILESLMAGPDAMKKAKTNADGDEMDESYAYKAAAEELVSAIDSKDMSGVVEAMKSFVEMCMMDAEMAEEQEESEYS